MNKEQLIKDLVAYEPLIIKELTKNNGKLFNDYLYINKKYKQGKLDIDFENKFCNFYRLNQTFSLEQKRKFFTLLEIKEKNLKNILKELYKIPNLNKENKLELSFSTKLLHTLDNNLPIYDINISSILNLTKQSKVSFQFDLNNRLYIYQELKYNINLLLKDSSINNYLNNFNQLLVNQANLNNFFWSNNLITKTKLLDFILWSLYNLKK